MGPSISAHSTARPGPAYCVRGFSLTSMLASRMAGSVQPVKTITCRFFISNSPSMTVGLAGGTVVIGQQVFQLDRGAEQVAEGGFVFGAVQAAQDDASLAALLRQGRRVQPPAHAVEDGPGLGFRRPRLAPGRHLSPRQALV